MKTLGLATKERGLSHNEFRTLNESGLPGFDVQGWNGLCAPAGVPKEVVTRLHAALVDTFGGDEARNKFIKLGFDMLKRQSSPEEFATLIRADVQKWDKVVKQAGIKPD